MLVLPRCPLLCNDVMRISRQGEHDLLPKKLYLRQLGSAQESVEARILGCFPEDNKFGLGGRHPLRFQQEVAEVLIAPAAP